MMGYHRISELYENFVHEDSPFSQEYQQQALQSPPSLPSTFQLQKFVVSHIHPVWLQSFRAWDTTQTGLSEGCAA